MRFMNKQIFCLTIVLLLTSSFICKAEKGTALFDGNNLKEIIQLNDSEERYKAFVEYLDGADDYLRFFILNHIATTCVENEAYDKAAEYASEVLLLAERYRDNWNYGNAVHDGNMVLGVVALHKGQIGKAIQYLEKSANTTISPQLHVYGPSMMLADALLREGKKENVIDYLDKIKDVWLSNDGQLDSWIYTIKGGGTPYFGLNLFSKYPGQTNSSD